MEASRAWRVLRPRLSRGRVQSSCNTSSRRRWEQSGRGCEGGGGLAAPCLSGGSGEGSGAAGEG